ncbi:MAG: ferrous iron transport protein B [Leptospirales bacterium]|nr:ferrous iron transport protein B [Leptospirales bacterium]
MKSIKVALVGQPNVGKSTLFNSLSGINQYVANYPGATVEFMEAKVKYKNRLLNFIDLPGTYSLNSFAQDEKITVDLINKNKPDIIINIINSTSLEQNLYLTAQLMELNIPLVLFLNMSDIAASKGIFIDCNMLSEKIGIPVISGVAKKKIGIDELLEELIKSYDTKRSPVYMPYSPELESHIKKLSSIIKKFSKSENPRLDAIKLIEDDTPHKEFNAEIVDAVEKIKDEIKEMTDIDPAGIFLKERYRIFSKFESQCLRRENVKKKNITPVIDSIFLNRFAALPLFFLFVYIIFQIVFSLGSPMIEWIESLFDYISASISSLWPADSDSLLRSVIVDGIIAGTGGVLVFAPNVFLLFLGIAFLESSGYMARVAVIMDRYMTKIGLSGKSFIPMVLGFGCNVPAIMGTRIIGNKRERFATILSIPFMSCSARLPIYVLLISIFIDGNNYKALTLLIVYLFGIGAAMITAKALRLTVFRGDGNPLIIELPDYSLPSIKGVLIQTWERGKHFLLRAGTIILAASIILWALTTFPRHSADDGIKVLQVENSYMGQIGRVVEPAINLMGGDWRIGSAFVASLAAKEVFVSQLGILFSLSGDKACLVSTESDTALQEKISETYTLPAVLAFIIFMLLSPPCIATFAAIKYETGAWRWSIFQYIFMTIVAFSASVIVFQLGRIIIAA